MAIDARQGAGERPIHSQSTAAVDSSIVNRQSSIPLRVVVARSPEGLAEHAAAWDEVLRAVPHPAPQLSYAWVATLLEHEVGPGDAWCCCFAYDGERLVGVLPVVARPHQLLGGRWPRLRAPENAHTRIGALDQPMPLFALRLSQTATAAQQRLRAVRGRA